MLDIGLWVEVSSNTWTMSPHCLLGCMAFDELLIILRIPCTWRVASFMLLSRLSLSLTSDTLIMMCLGVDLFELILLGICGASGRCRLAF